MSDEILLDRRHGNVAVVTLNRPDRLNAWTGGLETAYFEALAECDRSPDVRAVVVTGAGRGFCAGADLGVLAEVETSAMGETMATRRPVTFPLTVRKPLVGAINGACVGIGLVQALMLDVRFAAAGAKMGFAFARRAVAPDFPCAWLLPRIVGASRAAELLISSRLFPAEEALDLGLVSYVSSPDSVLGDAMEYASDLAMNCSPIAIAGIKRLLRSHAAGDLDTARAENDEVMRTMLSHPDFREGVRAYLEKRSPSFGPLGSDGS